MLSSLTPQLPPSVVVSRVLQLLCRHLQLSPASHTACLQLRVIDITASFHFFKFIHHPFMV